MTSDNNVIDLEILLSAITNGKWSIVLEMYKKKRELRWARITATGDTVLHIAVSLEKERVVKSMVAVVSGERNNEEDETSALLPSVDENGDEKKLVLGAENEKGNTPLHLAALIGNTEMCKKIGGACPFLIAKRNSVGETPLFMAALHGNRRAFLSLHYLYMGSPGVSSIDFAQCIRRDNSDTILYCAMEGGHIDVAIEIVYLYKANLKEMMMHNKNELSLLHLLAVNPLAFESTDLPTQSFLVQLLYHWFVRIKKKEQATTREELEQLERKPSLLFLMRGVLNYATKRAKNEEVSSWAAKLWDLIVILLCLLAFLPLFPLLIVGKWFHGIREMKEKHTWSVQILEELLQHASYEDISAKPDEKDNEAAVSKIVDTPLMVAAKNGVIEMVEKIFQKYPSTMKDVNEEGRNIVLFAAEKRQTKVYQILCENKNLDRSVFREVDKDGNTALHLAAKPGVHLNWQTTTMVDEFKWFEFVKNSVPSELWEKYNKDGKTAEEMFEDSHKEYMATDRDWLNQTSQSGSVVSTLVASMAFSNVTANFDEKNHSSLVALSFSLTSTISFLGILAFRSQSLNFWRYVPFMLHIAIFAMFGSIVSLWISLMLHGKSFTAYAILGSPISILTIVSLPIFIGPMLMSMFTKVPPPSRKTASAIRYRRPRKKED